jgi:hypothetical protein
VSESTDPFDPGATRAGSRVSEISIAWTLVGSCLAIAFGVRSESAALIAFGAVGLVDLVGSVALVHHFRHALRTDALSDHFEQRAHRIVIFGLSASAPSPSSSAPRVSPLATYRSPRSRTS